MTAAFVTSCSGVVFDCGGAEYRDTVAYAPVSDSAQRVALEGYLALNEVRGSSAPDARGLNVGVQSVRTASSTSVPRSMVGHLARLRLETADGTVLYAGTAHQPSAGNPIVLGSAESGAIDAKRYETIRDELLAGRLSIAMEMDAGAPALVRSVLRVETSSDWRKHCQ